MARVQQVEASARRDDGAARRAHPRGGLPGAGLLSASGRFASGRRALHHQGAGAAVGDVPRGGLNRPLNSGLRQQVIGQQSCRGRREAVSRATGIAFRLPGGGHQERCLAVRQQGAAFAERDRHRGGPPGPDQGPGIGGGGAQLLPRVVRRGGRRVLGRGTTADKAARLGRGRCGETHSLYRRSAPWMRIPHDGHPDSCPGQCFAQDIGSAAAVVGDENRPGRRDGGACLVRGTGGPSLTVVQP